MERTLFLKGLTGAIVCPNIAPLFASEENHDSHNLHFIENWLTDLCASMEEHLDHATMVKIMGGCGRGCFNRHQFKKDIAEQGKGSLSALIHAYKNHFEVWQDEDVVHIRYGETSKRCYCPVVQNIPPKENDLHCECTRATHQTIFETSLQKPVRSEIVESLRRGGKTCHFKIYPE